MTENITIDGVDYQYDSLSDEIKQLIHLRSHWIQEAQRETMKIKRAIRDVTREIEAEVEQSIVTQPHTTVLVDGVKLIKFHSPD